jgi:hypothetical protein
METKNQRLDRQIGEHMAERERLRKHLAEVEQAIAWQTRRIRELSRQFSINLNMTLPMNGQEDQNAP